MDLEVEMRNYDRVKQLVLGKLVSEGLLEEDVAEEFKERCQVLVYKGTWFKSWFDKNMKVNGKDEGEYYIRIIELKERESEVDRLIRRTNGGD